MLINEDNKWGGGADFGEVFFDYPSNGKTSTDVETASLYCARSFKLSSFLMINAFSVISFNPSAGLALLFYKEKLYNIAPYIQFVGAGENKKPSLLPGFQLNLKANKWLLQLGVEQILLSTDSFKMYSSASATFVDNFFYTTVQYVFKDGYAAGIRYGRNVNMNNNQMGYLVLSASF